MHSTPGYCGLPPGLKLSHANPPLCLALPRRAIWSSSPVEPPGFGADVYRIDAVAVDADSGAKGMVTADSDGHVETGGHKLSSIDPMVPVYGTVAGHFPLSADRGHHLVLRFHANDLGRAAFDAEPLAVTPRGLVFDRYDTEIRFVRVRP